MFAVFIYKQTLLDPCCHWCCSPFAWRLLQKQIQKIKSPCPLTVFALADVCFVHSDDFQEQTNKQTPPVLWLFLCAGHSMPQTNIEMKYSCPLTVTAKAAICCVHSNDCSDSLQYQENKQTNRQTNSLRPLTHLKATSSSLASAAAFVCR